jgi:death-on-curing protein
MAARFPPECAGERKNIRIVKNHPFIDGQKRTALIVAETFLMLNGFDFSATDQECVIEFEA